MKYRTVFNTELTLTKITTFIDHYLNLITLYTLLMLTDIKFRNQVFV